MRNLSTSYGWIPRRDLATCSMTLSVAFTGALSIALIVVLGIFVFPALLQRRGGWLACAVLTVALAALFTWFQAQSDEATPGRLIAAALAGAAPLVTGLIVRRLQRASA